jgi:hypothetical protein
MLSLIHASGLSDPVLTELCEAEIEILFNRPHFCAQPSYLLGLSKGTSKKDKEDKEVGTQ